MSSIVVYHVRPDRRVCFRRLPIWLGKIAWSWSQKPIIGKPRRPFDAERDRWDW